MQRGLIVGSFRYSATASCNSSYVSVSTTRSCPTSTASSIAGNRVPPPLSGDVPPPVTGVTAGLAPAGLMLSASSTRSLSYVPGRRNSVMSQLLCCSAKARSACLSAASSVPYGTTTMSPLTRSAALCDCSRMPASTYTRGSDAAALGFFTAEEEAAAVAAVVVVAGGTTGAGAAVDVVGCAVVAAEAAGCESSLEFGWSA
mmetsp:Transcript_26639/g.82405  ORF Transcript_26639/g.82405 Transcript_26639/m.82405 type:complete len:201 (+) Transcript_26639:812-1414(+)